jgi:tyrosine aminotransferase
VAIQAIIEAVQSPGHAASYVPACGKLEARQAIAAYHQYQCAATTANDNSDISIENVIVANGCSGALELAITALMDNNDDSSILLVPDPGFPLYEVIAESHGAMVQHYRLLPNSEWQCDLDHLRQLLLSNSKRRVAVVVNNPSNPTGAVFSKDHLKDIVSLCEEFRVPILADEVYGDLTFADCGDNKDEKNDHQSSAFYPLAHVAASMGQQVPVITASGLAKQFLLPGWRVGWIVFQDK